LDKGSTYFKKRRKRKGEREKEERIG